MKETRAELQEEIYKLSGNRLDLHDDIHTYYHLDDLISIRDWLKDLIAKSKRGRV